MRQIELDQIVNVNHDDLNDSDEKLLAFNQKFTICVSLFFAILIFLQFIDEEQLQSS